MQKLIHNRAFVIGASVVLGLLSALVIFLLSNQKQNLAVQAAENRSLIAAVSATGQVKASEEVDLAFGKSGTIAAVYADVGQAVRKGQTIAALQAGDLQGQLAQAKATLAQNQIKLDELQNAGSASASSDVSASIANNRQTVADKLRTAYTSLDSAEKLYIDQFFKNLSTNPIFGATISQGNGSYTIQPQDANLEQKINGEREDLDRALSSWADANKNLNDDNSIQAAENQATIAINAAGALLSDIADVLNSYTPSDATSKAVYDSYRANVATARAAVDSASSGILTAKEAYTSAQSAVGPYSISLAQANVQNAQGAVQIIQAQIQNAVIVAPFDGVVSRQDAKVGQTASPGQTLVGVISNQKFEVDAQIAENDIGKIAVGQNAKISLDTYGPSVLFDASVSQIDPAETITDGVGTYKVTLTFTNDDPRIHSGMTANASIMIGSKDNALSVPSSAIIRKGSDTFVLVENPDKTFAEKQVVVGIESTDGWSEITSGLNQGDMIATFGNNH